jgi:hypothetical protein
MGLEGSQSDKLDVRGRLKRYAALRAALRAVSPAFPPETSGALQERAQELSGRLRRAASPDEQPEAAAQTPLHVELDQIDKAWEEFARELLSLVSDLPLSQLRATLPAVQESNPEEVLALLDLCVADERALGERWNLLDYLVTLASTETDDGRKRVALDPATLTPSLEALCAATGERADADLEDLVREFQAAGEQISRGEPLAPIRTRLRDTKKSAVTLLPAPDVLRAVIACNVALWNRLEELTEVDRTLAAAERRRLKPVPAAPEPARAETVCASVFDSQGMRELEAALGERLRGSEPSGDAVGLLDRLDTSSLSRVEEAAFTSWEDERSSRVARIAAALGLLMHQREKLSEHLVEVGASRDMLADGWIPEIAQELLAATDERLSDRSGATDAARLAEVRIRFLRTASERSLWSEGDPAAEDETAVPEPKGPARSAERRKAPRRAKLPRTEVSIGKRIGLAVGVCLVAAAVGLHFWISGRATVRIYSDAQVAEISPHLESVYRSEHGYGPLLIGTLKEGWAGIPAQERVAIGSKIGEQLRLDGVDEVMLFDKRQRLEIHYSHQQLRRAARPN